MRGEVLVKSNGAVTIRALTGNDIRELELGDVVDVTPVPAEPATVADYGAWDKADLEHEAAERGLDVSRADGKDGDPLVSDLVAALEASDTATDA